MSAVSFEGQAVVVTGAGRGLGRAYATAFAARGAAVVVNDVAVDHGAGVGRAQRVAQDIVDAGGRAVVSTGDVVTAEGGQAVIDTALEAFGRVDVVVHNAGFLRPGHFEDLSAADIRDVLDVHLLGAFHVCQPAFRHMKGQGFGRIVLTSSSSILGHQANSNYAAAKAGLLGLTTALAAEGAAYGIGVNAVLPYAVSVIAQDNPLVGADNSAIRAALDSMSARRTPESVAALVLYLASRACEANGFAFSALAGRYARAFMGITGGWVAASGEVAPDDVADRFPEIAEIRDVLVPASMLEEIESVRDRLGMTMDGR